MKLFKKLLVLIISCFKSKKQSSVKVPHDEKEDFYRQVALEVAKSLGLNTIEEYNALCAEHEQEKKRRSLDLRGKNKGEVLAALYNYAQAVMDLRYYGIKDFGLMSREYIEGILMGYSTPLLMTAEKANLLLKEEQRFDKIFTASLKVDLSGDYLDPVLYDRDNGGNGSAAHVLSIYGLI